MIIPLLTFGFVVAALVACAARALEPLAGAIGFSKRFIWLGAMALAIALPAWRVYAVASSAPAVALSSVASQSTSIAAPQSAPRNVVGDAIAAIRGGFAGLLDRSSAIVASGLPSGAARYIAAGWLGATAALLLLLLLVERRGRRRTERWPEQRVHGVTVRVSDQVGPVVIGLSQPRIVVPAWLLQRHAEEQRAALAHEQEHVRARDTWVLASGWLAAALTPWNPALWYMLARLRLSVEMDCDARVLRAGFAAREYGELLISVAEHASVIRPGALALSGGPSHLHRRILAMTAPVRRFTPMRFIAAGSVAAIALLAACQAELPTQADVANLDAARASAAAYKYVASRTDTGTVFTVDDVRTTRAAAESLSASEIGSINISRDSARKLSEIRITTLHAYMASGRNDSVHIVAVVPDRDRTGFRIRNRDRDLAAADSAAVAAQAATLESGRASGSRAPAMFIQGNSNSFQGLVLIDGVKSDRDALARLNALDIGSVEVLKGAAAIAKYKDPAAVYGVIRITTKH
jgi:beta-lactamase regulating signal transducer with metallopeptidase domain